MGHRTAQQWEVRGLVGGALLACTLLLSCASHGGEPAGLAAHSSVVQPSASRNAPLPPAGDPISAARTAILNFSHSRSLSELAENLTNQSAAETGVQITVPMGSAVAASALDRKKRARDPAALKDFNSLLLRYGIPSMGKELSPELKANGRRFLKELDGFQQRLRNSGLIGKDRGISLSSHTPDLDKMSFKVISPSRVKIDTHDRSSGVLEARMEDGKWRIQAPSVWGGQGVGRRG